MSSKFCQNFSELTPHSMLDAVERGLGEPMTPLAHPLSSYINRVYEVQATSGTRYIAKFYRPGRWSREAILQEHEFVLECASEDIPVVAPLPLGDDETLGETDAGVMFAVYAKGLGRELEPITDEDWRRLGRVVGRMHAVGQRHEANTRIELHPLKSTTADVQQLLEGDFVAPRHRDEFANLANRIIERIAPLFDGVETIRIHGDCHNGNLLERPGEGILVIDFDDMAMGPPVQDLWMLLPEHARDSRYQINLILEGYEDFREFDDFSLRLIEPLRAMRILYFLAWCSRQVHDPKFRHNFPNWGDDAFWQREIRDLTRQLEVIEHHLG
jgi:Ser/Thr protein kinase RdoA (MazF antagonist)